MEVRGLSKSFGEVRAVDDVDLIVAPGEILGLLGPSGCGKTTFLRLVAGFERPDRGRLDLAGRLAAGEGTFVPPERRGVGLVFQDYALFPHMTVAENVGYGIPRSQRQHVVPNALNLVGLADSASRYPHELSGGEQQRAALARALAPNPSVVLLDEPFSNLDASLRAYLRMEVRNILRFTGATVVFVTHDQEEALSLADRIAIMRNGRILQVDTPDRVYRAPADPFVAFFVGGANLLEGRSFGSHVECALGRLDVAGGAPSGDVYVALRPESVRVQSDANGGAVVRQISFYGHDQVVEVQTFDGLVLRARYGPRAAFAQGERVHVVAVPHEALVFARN